MEQRAAHKQPIDGPYLRGENARRIRAVCFPESEPRRQLESLAFPGAAGRDDAAPLYATGHMLEWLVQRLPENRLDDPQIVRAVQYVTAMLGSPRFGSAVPASDSRSIDAVAHATRGLLLYDERVFQGAEEEKPAAG